ncbi:MAG TPA: hypothetical protein VM598_03250 [Bdellovibrionota bacterium]|nr:hypothetical protein [Bdellovibrionota bacterium]
MRPLLLFLVASALSVHSLWARASDGDQDDCANQLIPALPSVRPDQERELTVWRYAGHEDFNSADQVQLLVRSGDGPYHSGLMGKVALNRRFNPIGHTLAHQISESYRVTPNPIKMEMQSGSRGNSLLDRNQYYALRKMISTGYLDEAEMDAQVELSHTLRPRQVTYFEVTESRKGSELMAEFGKIPDSARRDAHQAAAEKYFSMYADFTGYMAAADSSYDVKIGNSYLVSGQFGDRIPLDDSRIEIPIDRERFPYVFEIGRGAQDEPTAFADTLRAGAYFALTEMFLLGARPEQGFVFGHALRSGHTIAYRRVHRMTPYSGYRGSPEEQALVIRLDRLSERLGLKHFSPAVRQLHEMSDGRIGELQALELELKARQFRTSYLEAKDSQPGSPLVQVRDFSSLPERLIEAEIRKSSIPRDLRYGTLRSLAWGSPKVERRDYLKELSNIEARPYSNPPQGKNGYAPEPLTDFLARENALETVAPQAPEGVDGALLTKLMLLAVYDQKLRQMRELGIANPAARLEEWGIRFAVVAADEASIRALRTLNPAAIWEFHRGGLETVSGFGPLMPEYREVLQRELHLYAYAIPASELRALAKADPALARQARGFLVRGSRHAEAFLSDIELIRP